jgi:GT2 family glycosyltransferase
LKLSVVILNYNVKYFLELCLKSVQKALVGIEAEIIVVDNNSPDDSCKMVEQLFPDVALIANKNNLGFSKGNNQGVQIAKGEYICILNPDTVVSEDTFTKLLEFAKSKENLGIVGCKLIDGAGKYLPESKRNIPIVKIALQKILGNSKNYYANHINENDIAKADVLVGAFMFMKRDVFNAINGFDEDYFMYGEDIDMSYKSLSFGYENYYYGVTTIIHYKGESTLKNAFYAKRFYQSMQIFYKKHYKKNFVFDVFVWLGIKLAYAFSKERKIHLEKPNAYYLISNQKNRNLEHKLDKDLTLKSSVIDIKENSEIIFDANFLSYKQIIENMSQFNKKEDITFKILPDNSNYIIGSNSSFSQGEVMIFDKN